ncbi:hypothetical protein Tco_1242267, partial [Tanacetum coccineum]
MLKESKHLGISKEVRTPRYPSLVVPLKKVGYEAVHKELGDRMERAATIASSLEAEYESGSGPRCQDTILGDVNAQTRFEIASKQSNDPPLSRGYTLGSGEDNMKLLELKEFCTQLSYKNIKSVLVITGLSKLMLLSIQFLLLVYFTAAKLMLGSVNAIRHMLMLPVQVPAAEGEKPIEIDGFAEIIDFLKASSVHYALTVNPIIYTSFDKQRVIVTESSIRRDLHLDDAEEEDPEVGKEENVKTYRFKETQENIDADVEVTLVDETQERQDDELMFDTGVLDTDEMLVEEKVDEEEEQSTKLDDSTAGEAVATASIKAAKPKVVTTAATTTTTTTTTRPKDKRVVVQEPSKFRVPQEAQPSISKDKVKGIMIEPEVPLKRKDQIALDEKIARDIQAKLDAKLIEEQKLARKQQEEANIALIESWENTQAMMEADRLL